MAPNIFTFYSVGNHPGRYTEAEVNSVEINRGSTNIPRPLLRFHSIKGDNVTLNDAKTIAARRPMFFCKGLAFSDRYVFRYGCFLINYMHLLSDQ